MPLTTVSQGLLSTDAQYTGFKNRIINGGMVLDQRNNGASVANIDGYGVDRWYSSWAGSNGRLSAQRTTTAPTGFNNSWLLTVTTTSASPASNDGNFFYQAIEGFNTADLAFGSASAQTVTLSFWVRSSITGTLPLVLANAGRTRHFGATYTVSSANTWEYKTITIAGDTSGVWATDNSVGINVIFGLSGGASRTISPGWQTTSGFVCNVTGCTNFMATSGATINITGVQLEKGSTATSFDYRPYGTELALCQRYYSKSYLQSDAPGASGLSYSLGRFVDAVSSYASIQIFFPVSMRAIPTVTAYNPQTGTINQIRTDTANLPASISSPGPNGCFIHVNNASVAYTSDSTRVHYTASAEL